MQRFVKLTYIIIVVLFLVAMSILGWYVMDIKKDTDIEIETLRNQIEELTLPKSDKEITTPDDVIIVKEYEYKTPTKGLMKLVAFDMDSKVVWEYKTDAVDMVEYSYDYLWPHYECVFSLENSKLVILNVFTGEKRAEVKFEKNELILAAGYYKGDIYVLSEYLDEDDRSITHRISKIDNDGHILASKNLESPIYDSMDQTVEKVEITRIDESEIEIFVTRLDTNNIEYITTRDF